MFENPELPDFDSMSQEELIAWLEALAKIQSDAASEFIDDYAGADGESEAADPSDETDEEWSEWLDDTQPVTGSEPPQTNAGDIIVGDSFEHVDEETPVDFARFGARESAPLDADAMAWLAEISAAETEENLPDITDYRPPELQPESLGEFLAQGDQEDPLDWLDSLAGEAGNPSASSAAEAAHNNPQPSDADGDDFDDAYEDDEKLDDLEDESLYTQRQGKTLTVLESLLGMEDRESEEYSTQSMAPVPDNVQSAKANERADVEEKAVGPRAEAAPTAGDSLTQAFLLQDQQVDLEAWYNSRLSAISSTADRATQSAALPALQQAAAPAKPPPPGLAAAINSARGKVAANELQNALLDYETLLRTNAGLEWVISDMRGLIAQDKYRENPSAHRVLGDALMRQGHLNAALDVYRHALTLL